jgi:hypothetical protein
MPAVSPQAFISVEASLTTRLWSTFLALNEELLRAMDKAAREKSWAALDNLVGDLDLEGVYDLNEAYIRYLSNVAMLFGASRATGRSKQRTHVSLGFDTETVDQTMASFRQMLATTGLESIQQQARTYAGFLSTEKSDEGMYLGLVRKFHNAGFNEAAHPRVPAGSEHGGEFAPKGGYPMRLSPLDSLPKKPSIEENLHAGVMQAPEGTPEFGTPIKGAMQVLGVHYSREPRKFLTGSHHGQGLKDAADERLSNPGTDPRLKQRIYFYVDEGHGVVPESGVGGYKHAVLLKNLYDPKMDHGAIWSKGKGDANASEKAVLDAGYDGYYVRNFANRSGVAVVLGDKTVQVKQLITKDDISGGDFAASGGMKNPDLGGRRKRRKDPAKYLTLQLKAETLQDSSITQGGEEAPDPLKKKPKPSYSEGRDAATPPGLVGPGGVPGVVSVLPVSASKAEGDNPVLPFSSFVDSAGKTFFNIASSLHTSRLSAWGYTAEARYLGIRRYQVDEQLDNRTCEVCQIMNGKTFDVADARDFLDVVTRTEDPDELRTLQPWPSQSKQAIEDLRAMSDDELVAAGWHVPPYHPRCRGLLSKALEQVPEEAGQAATPTMEPPQPAQRYVATVEDFAALGVTMTQEKVDEWNKLMETSPADLLAMLQGTSEEQITARAQLESESAHQQEIRDALGLDDLTVDSYGAVRLALRRVSSFHGGEPIEAALDLYYSPDRNLFISSVNLTSGHEAEVAYFLRIMLRSTYESAQAEAFDSMSMQAGADLSGYALAKYGFATSEDAWDALKTQVKRTLRQSAVSSMISEDEQLVLDQILQSEDPKDVFLLADLPDVGEALLAGSHYMGYLDLDDPESVARFLAYIYNDGKVEQ